MSKSHNQVVWHWATYRADKQRGVGVQSKHQPVEQFSGIHLQQDLRSGISNIFDNYLVCAIWNNVFFIIIKYVLLLFILLDTLHNLLCGTSHKCSIWGRFDDAIRGRNAGKFPGTGETGGLHGNRYNFYLFYPRRRPTRFFSPLLHCDATLLKTVTDDAQS